MAQNEGPYSIFVSVSVAGASVREVIASIKSLASQISNVLEHFQSTCDTLFSSCNLALANYLLTGSTCLFVFAWLFKLFEHFPHRALESY